MAIKSMIRLNQIKEQLGDFAKTADLATGYSHGGEGKNGLEETLSKLGESLHKRFGTDAVGTSGLHPDNAKGVVASFSSDDAANITIHTKNTANTISLLAGDSSADSGYLDLSNTVADLGTENSFVKVDDASIGQMFVDSKYEMKIDKTNEIALFGLDDLVLDMDGSGADGLIKLYSAETFIELTDDKSVKIGFNTNYPHAKMHVDPGAHISQLKLAADDGIAITGASHASGQQVFISSGVNEALLLDAGSMSKLSSGTNNYAQLSSTASVLAALHAGSNKTAQFTASNDAAAKATMTSDSAAADHYISVDRTGDGLIDIKTDLGTGEKIAISAVKSTQVDAIKLSSSVGGVQAYAASGKIMDVQGGQVALTALANQANAIYLKVDQGASETIKIESGKGTGAGAISLESLVGGLSSFSGMESSFMAGGDRAGSQVLTAGSITTAANSKGYGVDGFMADVARANDAFYKNTIWFEDIGAKGTWAEGIGVPLSVAKDEWTLYKDAFGEVSLLGALILAGAGAADAGTYHIEIGAQVAAADALLIQGVSPTVYTTSIAPSCEMVSVSSSTFDRSSLLNHIPIDVNTSMDEIFERLSVFVNGQRMVPDYWDTDGAAMYVQDFEVKVANANDTISSANPGDSARSGAGKLLINFHFDLESGDQVVINLK